MPRILVTNDDGIDAPGLAVLEKVARQFSDDVWVVAPETQQSGMAHSVSLHKPLRFKEVAPKHFAVSGTPTDCVITAVLAIMPQPVDLVLSGINRGPNVADSTTHSGTVAAAMEGVLCNIRSIAFSLDVDFDVQDSQMHWETAEHFAPILIERLLAETWEKDVLFNVNFPNMIPKNVKGFKCVAQGKHHYYKELLREDDDDGAAYWVNWSDVSAHPRRPDVDIHWLAEHYVTVTPLCLDLTHYAMLKKLKTTIES